MIKTLFVFKNLIHFVCVSFFNDERLQLFYAINTEFEKEFESGFIQGHITQIIYRYLIENFISVFNTYTFFN